MSGLLSIARDSANRTVVEWAVEFLRLCWQKFGELQLLHALKVIVFPALMDLALGKLLIYLSLLLASKALSLTQ